MYNWRNLSCEGKSYYVSGIYKFPSAEEGFGILEWCWDLEDAQIIKAEMEKDPCFSNLEIKSDFDDEEK